ncbi:MAG: hypothetical protein HY756_08805 [Nitrospirae bacterium]|nr:hypothetical protein [Nitrospirota bacterium]
MDTAIYIVFVFSVIVVSTITPLILSRHKLIFPATSRRKSNVRNILHYIRSLDPAASCGEYARYPFKAIWWDYIFPFLGIPMWFIMQALDAGSHISKSNFIIEIFIILMFSITAPWLRFAITYMKAGAAPYISFLLTLVPLAATILLRLVMPSLPE